MNSSDWTNIPDEPGVALAGVRTATRAPRLGVERVKGQFPRGEVHRPVADQDPAGVALHQERVGTEAPRRLGLEFGGESLEVQLLDPSRRATVPRATNGISTSTTRACRVLTERPSTR
jgi:hypothetical protein